MHKEIEANFDLEYRNFLIEGGEFNKVIPRECRKIEFLFGKVDGGIRVGADIYGVYEDYVFTIYSDKPIYAPKNCSYMFSGLDKLTEIIFYNFDTTYVESMEAMFYYCKQLTYLHIVNFNVKNVRNFNYMFWQCEGLTYLNLSDWDTSSAVNFSHMFLACYRLKFIDMSSTVLKSEQILYFMFAYCSNLKQININISDKFKYEFSANMIRGCRGLNVSEFLTQSIA